ncbi:autotransporter-associated beta strand repeat-containing protein [Plebeiibacterium marinum]|uniref:Autotransporter-associated beta strand repeat-containing protein n=1 Tax=Plebeiibacterium marinum TaxID=2992111 RepID=A0AAE3MGL0_9BACT|nr:autotransporter-associated beta strand repeat-containing protein [Plebeiobacterium marinum]MCW3807120.1 autotransporter-associated beta strand repeat-containing protein [Plebeiobacterium marinum]
MKRISLLFSLLAIFILISFNSFGQRKMEELDRGLIAVKTTNGVFLSWRLLGYEWDGVNFNIYRDGTKLNTEPLSVSNYEDANGTSESTYTVSAIVDGIEQSQCDAISPLAQQYLSIPMKVRNTEDYQINDATTADLDGDGEYEIIVKRRQKDVSVENETKFSYFEAYKLDGTLLWEINVGPNILSPGSVEINIATFDFNEDGKAEVFMRTSEGTIFGDGTEIGDTDGDGITNYRYSVNQNSNMQYMTEGPEFLSLIDGETGVELDRVDFIPRISAEWWGDSYGHRANKFFFGAPYLDGKHPSLFIGRGIYTKTVMRTYDVVDMKLVPRWEFRATTESDPYYAQGNHNYTVADVDQDGRDEIVWGGMTVDDDGNGLYSTEMGHGDALHVGDLDPYRKGTEIWRCLEENPVFGTALYDGATGEILIHDIFGRDCGRCMAANVSNEFYGAELWGSVHKYSATTREDIGSIEGASNFRIFWDGDLLEETLNHTNFTSTKGYGTGCIIKNGQGNILVADGAISCNYTKGTPCLQADLFGDWREEVVWRSEDDTEIRIYTTIDPTIYRNYSLMHDHQYRQAICWQMCGYNQPPHVSYFVGEKEGLLAPPPPIISNKKYVYTTGDWNTTSTNFNLDGNDVSYTDGGAVLFDVSAGEDVSLSLAETVNPKSVTVNSVGNYSLDATVGKLSGSMKLIKQGLGSFSLNGTHDYTGKTEIWNGTLDFNGTIKSSPVELEFFGKLNAVGALQNGLTLKYGSALEIGSGDQSGSLSVTNGLSMDEASSLGFDLYTPESTENDVLTVTGNFSFSNKVVFNIRPHLADGVEKLEPGKYLLVTVTGDINGAIENISVKGISGTPAKILVENGKVYLYIWPVRGENAIITWNGVSSSNDWDLAITNNFLNNSESYYFVDQDEVIFNDNAEIKDVNIASEVTPSSITVDASEDYNFDGEGYISGSVSFTKSGSGKLSILNDNDFSGKVSVLGGELVINSMPSVQNKGALGSISADASLFEINGGIVTINETSNSDRAISIGSKGATINTLNDVQWNEEIEGSVLTKTGAGQLVYVQNPNIQKTVLQEGTLKLLYDEVTPGDTISIQGGTVKCNSNANSYNTLAWYIEVPEDKTGTINMDARGYYTGKLFGGGYLNMNIPYVRTDLNGDMSEFYGTLNAVSTYSSKYNGKLRINHSSGLPNAHVIVNTRVYTSNEKGTTLILGALSGSGILGGSENYIIGNKNIDTEFEGEISAGSLEKVGTGNFTLSGNENSYTGVTKINGGILTVNNTSGSATGLGAVSVNETGTLSGRGIISGAVTINNGGTFYPGTGVVNSKMSLTNNLSFMTGSVYKVILDPSLKQSSYTQVAGSVNIAGGLNIVNPGTEVFAAGDEYLLFDCADITGEFESITPATPGNGLVWDLSELQTQGIIKVTISNGIEDLSREKITVYPNPAIDFVNVSFTTDNVKIVSLYTMDGLNISTISSSDRQITLSLQGLSSGIYVIRALIDEEIHQFKVVKN